MFYITAYHPDAVTENYGLEEVSKIRLSYDDFGIDCAGVKNFLHFLLRIT